MYAYRVLKKGERLVHSPPSFFQLTIWKALIKLHIFYYAGITTELLTGKLYLLSPVAWEREKRRKKRKRESREDEMANQQKKEKREKASVIEKETIKGERMGEAGQKIGKWGQKVRGKHLWERAAPAGVLDQEPQQGRQQQPCRAAGSLRNLVC